MEEIKIFVNSFTKQEAKTTSLRRHPNLEVYNNALQEMNNYCVESLHNTFGMVPLKRIYDQEYYDKWSKKKDASPRHLYKISHYKNDIYDDVYVAYVSERNPSDEIFLYGECLFVARINNELKIIKNYTFGDELLVKDKFEANQGLENISFETLSNPINIVRYMAPDDDEDGMEHYLQDI
jgi:hypothetical protein